MKLVHLVGFIIQKNVEDTIIKLKHECKKCALCWLSLYRYIKMHGLKNVKLFSQLLAHVSKVISRGKEIRQN